MSNYPVVMQILMCVCGLFTHFLKDMVRIKTEYGSVPSFKSYFSQNPVQTCICLISAFVSFVLVTEMNQMTLVTGYTIGYMANSLADVIGKRGVTALSGGK